MSQDITFCGSVCDNKKCFRHPSNIREPSIPHSYAYFKGTEDCPYGMKKTMTPEKAVERVISLLQSCKGSDGCLGYIERYIYEEDEQAIDIAIQILKDGEIYMTAEDFNLYMEGYKQGRKDFDRPQDEWVRKEDIMHYIATQYSEHNELVPIWLSIGDLKGGEG